MTPRRSSRARTTQPPTAAMQHANSSSSSNSLSRAERSTRSNNKISSPHVSSTRRSQSLDDADLGSKGELLHTRYRQRGRADDENDENLRMAGEEYDEEDGDEITRCICGQQDYPGLPLTSREAVGRSPALVKTAIKDEMGQNASTAASDILSEDAGSLFIQCDSCKVWQHGGCVGIMEEAMSPEEYFCEECRKDLHKIATDMNGYVVAIYLFFGYSLPQPPIHSVLFSCCHDPSGRMTGHCPNLLHLTTTQQFQKLCLISFTAALCCILACFIFPRDVGLTLTIPQPKVLAVPPSGRVGISAILFKGLL